MATSNMLKLVYIALFLYSAHGVPLENNKSQQSLIIANNDDLSELYRLENDIQPTLYDVILYIDPNNEISFRGSVSIRIIAFAPLQQIRLHAMELNLDTISVLRGVDFEGENDYYASHVVTTDDTQFLTINLNAPLEINAPYFININYEGHYAANMFGLYVSTYEYNGQTRRLVTSQLQPTYARRVFPCFDEPHLKAIYRTTIYAHPAYGTVRSNMPNRETNLKPEIPEWTKHEFQDSLIMSSYLQAYLVSDFVYVENSVNDIYHIPFRVYSRPGTEDFGTFALRFGQENMVALESYTDFPYAFPKLDKVAVPDFAAGAMENWGLVVYREVALLVQDGVTSTSTLQNIGRIITHENMHMWFGNEVSPLSWTYTWLNEGFANFFESFGTDMVHPEWRMMDQFVLNMQNVFQSDAVLGVNPMTFPVYTPLQVLGTFNAVAYQKSGSVIRMLQHVLTPEVFQNGLRHYLRENSRRAATPVELYASLQQALDESDHTLPITVAAFMNQWTNQGGFPVLTMRRTAPAATSFSIIQERFLTDPGLSSNDVWHIPINWVLSSNIDFSDTRPQVWLGLTSSAGVLNLPELANAEWFLVNKQQTGYYRVNYDRENWVALSNVLSNSLNTIPLLNRAQLIDDAFNLARNGRLDYEVTFNLIQYLVNEEDYIPWAAANAGLNYLSTILSGTSIYNLFERFVVQLSEPTYERLGFTPNQNDEHVTAFFRNTILNLNCRHGNQDCIANAERMLQELMNGQTTLHPDIQNTVFCSGLRGGSADNYDFLWRNYLASTDSSEQSILLSALGCTSHSGRLEDYLNQVISPQSQVREQDRHSVIVSVINAGPANREVALDFVIEHFDEIQPRVQGLTGTTNILNAFSTTLTSQSHFDKINDFRQRHNAIFTAAELASVNAIQENIAAALTWSRVNYGEVDYWLRTNNASSLVASLVVMFSAIVALLNF